MKSKFKLSEIPRLHKKILVLVVDISLCLLASQLALYLRLDTWVDPLTAPYSPALLTSVMAPLIFYNYGVYNSLIRYWITLNHYDERRAVLVYALSSFSIYTVLGISEIPRSFGILQPLIFFPLLFLARYIARTIINQDGEDASLKIACLVYGTTVGCRQFASYLENSNNFNLIGFVDSDESMHGSIIAGKKIYSSVEIVRVIREFNVGLVVISKADYKDNERKRIIDSLIEASVSIRYIPNTLNFEDKSNLNLNDLMDLEIDDLLGRPIVPPDSLLMEKIIYEECVLVTGAGGSIGGELSRQIFSLRPNKILLVDQSEPSLFAIYSELVELEKIYKFGIKIEPLLLDVLNDARLNLLFEEHSPTVIYHAAAYKHVDLVERNPFIGVSNNIFSALNIAKLALGYSSVKFCTLISSDKAVRPIGFMGASKRISELIFQAFSASCERPDLKYSIVRFGNVLNSSGSVVPIFKDQIFRKLPVTVTDPEVTRFFMTIQEAAQLVIQASAISRGGEIFLLDMGAPVRILDLATRMIRLSGLTIKSVENPKGDIPIVFTGLKAGEKLHEELLIDDKAYHSSNPRIYYAQEPFISIENLTSALTKITKSIELNSLTLLKSSVQELVAHIQ